MRQVVTAAVGGLFVAACGSITEPEDVLDCGAVDGLLACNTFEADDPAWTTVRPVLRTLAPRRKS